MNSQELDVWLKGQQKNLDQIVANTGREFHEASKAKITEYGFDLAQCQRESFHLIDGEDLCYDRPNTPFTYSLWYHPRRVNTFLSYFASSVLSNTETIIDVLDLGAGTGAVQWAIGLVYHRMKELGLKVPRIRIINVDTSPFMLYYGRDYLWKSFCQQYIHAKNIVTEYEVNAWSNESARLLNPWMVASYLFDISDASGEEINIDYRNSVKAGFKKLIDENDPSKVFLLTSSQPAKRGLLNELVNDFERAGYSTIDVAAMPSVFNGSMPHVNALREELGHLYKKDLKALGHSRFSDSLNKSTSWNEGQFMARVLSRRQVGLNLATPTNKKQNFTLFNVPIKVRRDVDLNDDQKKAAEHNDRPTVISGPAGCGKSIVITERLVNLIEKQLFSPDLNILLTTFNKDLMKYLGDWIEDLLNKNGTGKFRRVGNNFYFTDEIKPNVTLLHIDVLPTRLGRGLGALTLEFERYHHGLMARCIEEIKRERSITTAEFDKVLNTQYALDEYHRVIYGQQYTLKEDYYTSDRKGRPRLKPSGPRRELLWALIVDKYLVKMTSQSIISRRHRFLQQLKKGEVTVKYSHVFLDEFQDCTEADYAILYLILADPNNLVIAGDIAQALQIGSVADVPRLDGEIMQRRVFHRLKGSYRLPFRVGECIAKISESIENGGTLTPYKGAPPGARPLLVYAENEESMAAKVLEILNNYGTQFSVDSVTILETDYALCEALDKKRVKCSATTILRIKGMERSCIFWSTRQDIAYPYEVEEFVHTILTRTVSILIIGLFPETLTKYCGVIGMLRADRLIYWDEVSKIKFDEIAGTSPSSDDIEEI